MFHSELCLLDIAPKGGTFIMLGNSIKKFALNQAFNYIEKDPI